MAAHLATACSFVRSLTHAQNELAAVKVAGLAPSLPDNGGLPGARPASRAGLICAAQGHQQGVRLEDLYEWPERVPVSLGAGSVKRVAPFSRRRYELRWP